MKPTYSFKIFSCLSELPTEWDVLSKENIFLSRTYIDVLERSAPANMVCHYIGIFKEDELVGIALSQFLNLSPIAPFGNSDQSLSAAFKKTVFKNLISHVLIIGNNMLTGQNAFSFLDKVDKAEGLKTLKKASESIQEIFRKKGLKVHITALKDFGKEDVHTLVCAGFQPFARFSTQPNMVFDIQPHWKTENDYINALSKKYCDQYQRARRKAKGIEKRKMDLHDIKNHNDTIYNLYYHVASQARFNTFYLAKNHFWVLKEVLNDRFLFYGYFLNDELIGFNTLIKNGTSMDTYFLGYDKQIQREKMVYLNMLYDMVAYSINNGYKEIVFGRTALEIKSSIGAKPRSMIILAKHSHAIADLIFKNAFNYFEPKVSWMERNPFR